MNSCRIVRFLHGYRQDQTKESDIDRAVLVLHPYLSKSSSHLFIFGIVPNLCAFRIPITCCKSEFVKSLLKKDKI